MIKVDKEVERQRDKILKNKVTIERKNLPRFEDYDEDLSFSSISIYSLDSSEKGSSFLSTQNPPIVRHNTPLLMHEE